MSPKKVSKVSKFKYIVLAALVLILLACIGVFGYFMLQSRQKVERIQAALAALANGDRDAARTLFIDVLSEDPNNETAIVKLAELSEQDGIWSDAAQLWLRAAGLNEFKPEYEEAAIRTLLRGRDFIRLNALLERKKQKSGLTPPQTLMLGLAAFRTGQIPLATQLLSSITDAKTLASPLADLLENLLNTAKQPDSQRFAEMEKLAKSDDPVVAFEALHFIAYYQQSQGNQRAAETTFKAAAALNPYNGDMMLADYYYYNRDYDAAIAIYRKILGRTRTPDAAIRLGEALAIQNKPAEIRELSKKYNVGNKQMLLAGYYLDALAAFLEGNEKELAENLKPLTIDFRSPMALFMMMHSAIYQNNPAEVERIAEIFSRDARYREFEPKIADMLLPYIDRLAGARQMEAAARLARMIQKKDQPNLILSRLIIADDLRRNSLNMIELARALKAFPNDLVLLDCAAAAALQRGDYAEALKMATRNKEAGADIPPVNLQILSALEGLKRIDDANALFLELRKKTPADQGLATLYLDFCIRTGRTADLARLADEFGKSDIPAMRNLTPYIKAEIAFLENNRAGVIKELRQTGDGTSGLDYRKAYLYARIDEIDAAIAIYLGIAEKYPAPALIQVNLSELYAEKGDKAKALEAAEKAWRIAPEWSASQECYGIRLKENLDFERAFRLLDQQLNARNDSPRVLEAWRVSIENLIKQQFDAKEYFTCRDYCRRLSAKFPGNAVATEYNAKLAEVRSSEEKNNAAQPAKDK
jgi:Tfp pilus assembly protein PilF